MKQIKAGARQKSAVCDAEVMVIKIPAGDYELTCGGAEMLDMTAARDAAAKPVAGLDQGCLVGKRYVDESGAVEVLCTKAGKGSLALDGKALTIKEAKALPSSD